MGFSHRLGYSKSQETGEIWEDAPEPLRLFLADRILPALVYVDGDKRYRNTDNVPFGCKDLIADLCATIGQAPDSDYSDSWHCEEILSELIKNCKWFNFYDIAERIAKLLQIYEPRHSGEPAWIAKYGFDFYKFSLNEVLERYNVGWRLDETGLLHKRVPQSLAQKEKVLHSNLNDRYQPANSTTA